MSANKAALKRFAEAQRRMQATDTDAAIDAFFAEDGEINLVHPFEPVTGGRAYRARFLDDLRASFTGLQRSDYIAFGGRLCEPGLGDGHGLLQRAFQPAMARHPANGRPCPFCALASFTGWRPGVPSKAISISTSRN